MKKDIKKLALVCSSGGHLFELYSLKKYWGQFSRFWVTFKKEDANSMLEGERVYGAYFPTNRNVLNFIRNIFLSWKILLAEKPDLVISTGSGVAVPLIYLAKILGIKTIHIDSMTRIKNISLTGRLVYFFVDEFLVQWPELALKYKRAKYKGQVI